MSGTIARFTTKTPGKMHFVSGGMLVWCTTVLISLLALIAQLPVGAVSGNGPGPPPPAELEAADNFTMLRPTGGPWVDFRDDPEAMQLLREAEQLERDSKSAEAIELYERVIALRPGSPANAAVEYRIADIYNYVSNDNWVPDRAEAWRRYEEIVSKYEPTRAEVLRSHVWLAQLSWMERKDYEQAREHHQALADAKELFETRPEAFAETDAPWAEWVSTNLERAVTFLQNMERRDEIHRELKQAGGPWIDFQDDPEMMELIREADWLDNTLRTDEAVAAYERILLINPGSEANLAIEFRVADIYSYIRNDRWTPDQQEAKRRYEAIVAKYDPTRAEVIRSHKWLGDIYSREGDYVRAREHYQAVADAKELLETRPEAFHEIDALWAELVSLDIEQNLASVRKREREQAEQLAAAQTPVPLTSDSARARPERTGPTFTFSLPISDQGRQVRVAEKPRTDETPRVERGQTTAVNRVPRIPVLAAFAVGALMVLLAVVIHGRSARNTD